MCKCNVHRHPIRVYSMHFIPFTAHSVRTKSLEPFNDQRNGERKNEYALNGNREQTINSCAKMSILVSLETLTRDLMEIGKTMVIHRDSMESEPLTIYNEHSYEDHNLHSIRFDGIDCHYSYRNDGIRFWIVSARGFICGREALENSILEKHKCGDETFHCVSGYLEFQRNRC